MTEKDYKKLVEEVSKQPDNMLCVDCNSRNPKWVSIRYGTFMCLDCAGMHRSLGVYLDFIKSIGLDTWSREAYLPVKYGGNKAFKEYIETHKLQDSSISDKYQNQKVIEYSKLLMEQIKAKTGQEIKSADNKNRKTTSSTQKADYRKVNEEDSGNEPQNEDKGKTSSKIYSQSSDATSSFRSSLSGITATLSKHAKTLGEKTVVYGSKFGSAVAAHAKSIVSASSDAISNLRKDKVDERKDSSFVVKPKKNSKQDWS